MAKSKNSFNIEEVKTSQADQELKMLRGGRGGRRSKYVPIAEKVKGLRRGKSLKMDMDKNEVGGLRQYLARIFQDKYKVISSRSKDGSSYRVYVYHTKDYEKK